MPDAFFQKKRKRTASSGANGVASSSRPPRTNSGGSSSRRVNGLSSRKRAASESESEDGDDFDLDSADTRHRYDEDLGSDEEREAAETPREARVRMAKMYLDGLRQGSLDPEDADAAAADAENIASRLQRDISEHSGRLHIFVAARLASPPPDQSSLLQLNGGHRSSLNVAVASANGRYVYTAAKDGNIFRWRMEDGRIDLLIPRRRKNGFIAASSGSTSRAAASNVAGPSSTPSTMSNGDNATGSDDSDSETRSIKGKGRAVGQDGFPLQRHEIIGVSQQEGHSDALYSLALSSDGKMLVSGGKDRRLCVWSVAQESGEGRPSSEPSVRWVKALTGHKEAITGVKFRMGSHELYSSSLDRSVKVFDVDQLSYIETLFGHQESILSLDALRGDFAVSAGGRDRTARWWKIRDESQLVFRGGAKSKVREVIEGGDLADINDASDRKRIRGDYGGTIVEGSLDCVAMIDESHFLTGGDSGAISLWSLTKKKPVFTRAAAHGFDDSSSTATQDQHSHPRWITSLAALPYSDLFASGSWDGEIRLWQLDRSLRSFKALPFTIPAKGFINSLQLMQPPRASLRDPVIKPELWPRRTHHRKRDGTHPSSNSKNGTVDPHPDPDPAVASASAKSKSDIPPILIAAIGTEPRLGRWMKLKGKGIRSRALVVPLAF